MGYLGFMSNYVCDISVCCKILFHIIYYTVKICVVEYYAVKFFPRECSILYGSPLCEIICVL
jgi:hypothetical protein